MAVRTTLEIPEALHERLRQQAEASGASVEEFILRRLEEDCGNSAGKELLTGPFLPPGERGPLYPTDENPHDLILP